MCFWPFSSSLSQSIQFVHLSVLFKDTILSVDFPLNGVKRLVLSSNIVQYLYPWYVNYLNFLCKCYKKNSFSVVYLIGIQLNIILVIFLVTNISIQNGKHSTCIILYSSPNKKSIWHFSSHTFCQQMSIW